MRSSLTVSGLAAVVALAGALAVEGATIAVEQLPCLPLEGNGVVRARIDGLEGGYAARVYFRRLNNVVEDFYWVPMQPGGGSEWWAALPKPEDHPLAAKNLAAGDGQPPPNDPWAAWWKAKETSDHRDPNDDLDDELIRERASQGKRERRDWMESRSDADLQRWLESLDNEPAEYYVAVFDSYGKPLADGQSETRVVPVSRDCPVQLTPRELGQAQNLTVGETAAWEGTEPVFHWLCDGIVTRVDVLGILRADEVCRACVVAWVDKREFLIPAAVGAVGGISVISLTPPPNPSPASPGPR
jgi:hypothetical protein